MRSILAVVLSLLSLGTTGAAAQPGTPWSRVAAPRFVLSAEMPAGRADEVARRFELFQSAIAEVAPDAAPSLLPPFVVVFASQRDFSAFLPEGQVARVAAFVGLDETAPCVTFHAEGGRESFRAAFREYARVILRRTPLWFMEGAAEVYGTLAADEDGRHARLGEPVALNLLILKSRFVPLADLLRTERAQPGPEGEIFYAESWALAHYLLIGNPSLSRQVPSYVARVSTGTPPLQAFEEAFGLLATVEKDLRRHLEGGAKATRDLELPPAREAAAMGPAEVQVTLGRLLFYAKRDEEAARRLQEALAADPSLPDAHLALGIVRLGQGRFEEAFERLEKARALQPESLAAAYYLARAALQVAGAVDEARVEDARAALAKALVPETRVAAAWEILGTLSGRLGRLDEAERALRRALELSPGRPPAVVELVDVCVARGRFDEAGRLLDSIKEAAARAGVDLAPWRERVAREREVARVRADIAKAAGLPATSASPVEGRTGRWLIPPDYRQTGPGEERTHGVLQRIDCGPNGIVVQVGTAEGTTRFAAKALVNVQSISYREGLEPLLSCGARRELEPVFVTWRPGPDAPAGGDIRGTIVAIEFLGEEYLPRQAAPTGSARGEAPQSAGSITSPVVRISSSIAPG